jgi:hypothetical protein
MAFVGERLTPSGHRWRGQPRQLGTVGDRHERPQDGRLLAGAEPHTEPCQRLAGLPSLQLVGQLLRFLRVGAVAHNHNVDDERSDDNADDRRPGDDDDIGCRHHADVDAPDDDSDTAVLVAVDDTACQHVADDSAQRIDWLNFHIDNGAFLYDGSGGTCDHDDAFEKRLDDDRAKQQRGTDDCAPFARSSG